MRLLPKNMQYPVVGKPAQFVYEKAQRSSVLCEVKYRPMLMVP